MHKMHFSGFFFQGDLYNCIFKGLLERKNNNNNNNKKT